jgi:hypothetical protein
MSCRTPGSGKRLNQLDGIEELSLGLKLSDFRVSRNNVPGNEI